MRTLLPCSLVVLLLPAGISAQVPSGIVALENERSRTCVDVLSRLVDLDVELAPIAERAQRLAAIGQAISLEDDRIVEGLDASDPVEAAVIEWFAQDQELAQRYVATLAEELQTQRADASEAIRTMVADSIVAAQEVANARIEESDNLPGRAAECDGAIFVRPVVVEACATAKGPLCEAAALPASEVTGVRFVDDAASIWDVTEVRPWTTPTAFGVNDMGQLDGARSVAYARTGNVVVSVAFSPMLRDRTELTPEEAGRFQATNDSLGLVLSHPEIAIAPALSLRATLPEPLGDESTYVLHFGDVTDPDVVWEASAGSGAPIEASQPLGAAQVERLRAGEPVTFSALRSGGASPEPVFVIELTPVNQAQAIQLLVAYMGSQMEADLAQLVQPIGND